MHTDEDGGGRKGMNVLQERGVKGVTSSATCATSFYTDTIVLVLLSFKLVPYFAF